MKPHQILAFNAVVFILLGLLMLVFPKDGIKINSTTELSFIKPEELLSSPKTEYKDIAAIVDTSSTIDKVKASSTLQANGKNNLKDTLRAASAGGYGKKVDVTAGDVKLVNHPIQFPNNNKKVLYAFFDQLRHNSSLIHIFHYGDSQLEGDRITSFLRNQLQAQFGGCGVGLVPAKQPFTYNITLTQTSSPNWKRYTQKEHTAIIKNRKFGALMSFSRFAPLRLIKEAEVQATPAQRDTFLNYIDATSEKVEVVKSSKGEYSGWLKFATNARTYETNQRYQMCNMYYGYNQEPVRVELFDGDKKVGSTVLPANNTINVVRFKVNSPKELTMKFSGKDSPNIYGVSLDGEKGVAMDNVAMRGSAGTTFTQMNVDFLKQMYDLMNVKLIVLQFGGNVTPCLTKNYDYYDKLFSAQLEAFKKVAPNASILVIGPADMSRKVNGHYESYPNIPFISAALRSAAFKNGAAFWDMYEAMGGKNSMPSWVYANPSLAAKDFTHFSHKGAEVIARMFYNSLIAEYNEYLKGAL